MRFSLTKSPIELSIFPRRRDGATFPDEGAVDFLYSPLSCVLFHFLFYLVVCWYTKLGYSNIFYNVNEGDARVNYRFVENESEQCNCFSKNELVFFISLKLIKKTKNKHRFFFAKNSGLSRYLPLLDIYWRVDCEQRSQSDCTICNSLRVSFN